MRPLRRSRSDGPGEELAARVAGAADAVGDLDQEVRVLGLRLDSIDLDHVAEPTLERRHDGELEGGGEFLAPGCEDELEDTAAEVGPVEALAGIGEEELLDHVANMR